MNAIRHITVRGIIAAVVLLAAASQHPALCQERVTAGNQVPSTLPEPVRQTASEPSRQSIPGPSRQTASEPSRQSIPGPSRQTTSEPVRQSIPEPVRQTAPESSPEYLPTIELFAGIDLNYRRISFNERLYDLLIYIDPAVKFHLGQDWTISAQGLIPTINQWGDYYKYFRLGVISVSKELRLGENQHFKFSGGIFSHNRYGIDAKWMWPVNDWFALEGQLGLTGYQSSLLGGELEFSAPTRLSGSAKARFYIEKWRSEFRLSGGRYAYADWGSRLEFFTHFGFTTVGLYGQWGGAAGWGAGAKIVFMLPWQGGVGGRAFRLRLKDNFTLNYDVMADPYAMKTYRTDPEENERSGHFRGVKWGAFK